MNLIKIPALYGFARPYNFPRALAFLACITQAAVFFAVAKAHSISLLHPLDVPYAWFHVYLFWGAMGAALLSFVPRLAVLLFMFLSIDAGIAFGSHALHEVRPQVTDLLPDGNPMTRRFRYHPLLQASPRPSLITHHGDLQIGHDTQGLRGNERQPQELGARSVIAAFGGSTTYDIANSDGTTWPERLEQALGSQFAVLNHGVPGYSTVENLVQTAFYGDAYGVKPACALYYVGWNDIRNSYLPNLESGYADFHLLSQIDNLQVRRDPNAARISPLFKIIYRTAANLFDVVPHPRAYVASDRTQDNARLEQLYRRNIINIAALNNARGIKTIFVGQLLNRGQLNTDGNYGWLPMVADKDVWPLQARFNTLLAETAQASGALYIDAGIDHFASDDFADNGHFSKKGAEKFAGILASELKHSCTR